MSLIILFPLCALCRGPGGPAFTMGPRINEPDARVDAPGPGQYFANPAPSGPAFTMGAKFKTK